MAFSYNSQYGGTAGSCTLTARGSLPNCTFKFTPATTSPASIIAKYHGDSTHSSSKLKVKVRAITGIPRFNRKLELV
ncbi:MAG: hypothetical protein ACYC7D_10790 [Nitrososphaerales archaeon]